MSESIQIAEKDKFDTRKKLESDIIEHTENDRDSIDYNVVIEWLDRQAAITRAECQKDSENVADWEDSCDTREELEYDCKWMAYAWSPDVFPDDKLEKKLYHEIIEKLDRQAAITERECDTASWKANYRHVMKQRDELQERVDVLEEENRLMRERLRSIANNDVTVFGMKLDEVRNLQAENVELREKLDAYETREAEEADELLTKYENLKKRVVELEADNTKWVAENIALRTNLSKALDHAHAIGKLGEI